MALQKQFRKKSGHTKELKDIIKKEKKETMIKHGITETIRPKNIKYGGQTIRSNQAFIYTYI